MPTASQDIVPIPVPTQPVMDPATGLMTKPWYDYFKSLDRTLRAVRLEIP